MEIVTKENEHDVSIDTRDVLPRAAPTVAYHMLAPLSNDLWAVRPVNILAMALYNITY